MSGGKEDGILDAFVLGSRHPEPQGRKQAARGDVITLDIRAQPLRVKGEAVMHDVPKDSGGAALLLEGGVAPQTER